MYQTNAGVDFEAYKADIEIRKNAVKLQQNLEMRGQIALQNEAEREIRKGQSDVIEILEDGKVVVETRNLRVNMAPRVVANLSNPEMIKLVHAEKPTEYIWMFVGIVKADWKAVFLSLDKLESPRYLMKKIVELGAEIFACSSAEEKWMVKKLVRKLIHDSRRYKWIPEQIGWFVDEDGKIKFYEKEDLTWSYILEKAR